MNTKEVEALESYFKTENEHWNGYVFKLICEVLQKGIFEKPETPIKIFSQSIDIFTEHYATPIKAIQLFSSETEKYKINAKQKLFVFETVFNYVKYSVFEDIDLSEVIDLLKSHIERLKNEANNQPENQKPLVGNIRGTLKQLLQEELEQLPETLKALEPVQRLNVLCKLIPYVLPKVEAVHSEAGEPKPKSKPTFSVNGWE